MNGFCPDRLSAIMEIKKLSDDEVGPKIGVSRVSVHKWRVGNGYPSVPNLTELCTLFDVPFKYFFPERLIEKVTPKNKKSKTRELVGAK